MVTIIRYACCYVFSQQNLFRGLVVRVLQILKPICQVGSCTHEAYVDWGKFWGVKRVRVEPLGDLHPFHILVRQICRLPEKKGEHLRAFGIVQGRASASMWCGAK